MQDTQSMLKELAKIDTPTVTNAVATYPKNETCLKLYNPWRENWYSDQNLKCMFPDLGPRAGYAVTCTFGLPDPDYEQHTFIDVLKAVEAMPKPVVLVIKQKFPAELKDKVGLAGGLMGNSMAALGVTGLISDGPTRDLRELKKLGLQTMLTGACAGHGDFAVHAINVPVSVCGMDVAPGEIIHLDENGACKFPADKLEAVLQNCKKILAIELGKIEALKRAGTAEEVAAALAGGSYGKS